MIVRASTRLLKTCSFNHSSRNLLLNDSTRKEHRGGYDERHQKANADTL
jgi:hypothetical protein